MSENKGQAQIECGKGEESFPYLNVCCKKRVPLWEGRYEALCSCCKVWTSMPYGDQLVVTHIIECSQYGYGKRIKE